MLIDGRKIRDGIYKGLTERISRLSFKPLFIDVLVGDDPASIQYVEMKERSAKNLQLDVEISRVERHISEADLIEHIRNLHSKRFLSGLIVQLPLPDSINTQNILDSIDASIDVDVVAGRNTGLFYDHKETLIPPTAGACLAVLDSLKIKLTNKKIVILGKGLLVGRPVAELLHRRGVQFEVVDRSTVNAEQILKDADIVISGIGQPGFITANKIKPGVILIDAGTAESAGQIVGDVDLESIKDIASFVSPVPGGVGPVTIAKLLENVVIVAEGKQN